MRASTYSNDGRQIETDGFCSWTGRCSIGCFRRRPPSQAARTGHPHEWAYGQASPEVAMRRALHRTLRLPVKRSQHCPRATGALADEATSAIDTTWWAPWFSSPNLDVRHGASIATALSPLLACWPGGAAIMCNTHTTVSYAHMHATQQATACISYGTRFRPAAASRPHFHGGPGALSASIANGCMPVISSCSSSLDIRELQAG